MHRYGIQARDVHGNPIPIPNGNPMGMGITGENGNGKWAGMGINLNGNGNDTYSHGNLFPSSFQRMQATLFSQNLWKENCGYDICENTRPTIV